jgi:type II secretory pathway pseudopilin PulG
MELEVKDNMGFTLIEMVIATGIFLTVMVAASGVFLSNQRLQQRVEAIEKMQSDVSFTFEKIVNEVRFGKLDYKRQSGEMQNAHQLWVRNQDGRLIHFVESSVSGFSSLCKTEKSTPCLLFGTDFSWDENIDQSEYASLLGRGTRVKNLKFIITPSLDPFEMVNGVYLSFEQPTITILLEVEGGDSEETLRLQTTVNQRYYGR